MHETVLVEDFEPDCWDDRVGHAGRNGAGDWFEAIDGLPPNPASAAIVTMLDAGRMDGHDQLRLIKAQQELVSYATAQLYRSMVRLVETIAAEDELDADAPERRPPPRSGLHSTSRGAAQSTSS